MVKAVLKEICILILLCVAILLVFGVLFYDYIPTNKIVPNKVAYKIPEEVREELEIEIDDTRESITLTYDVDSTDLRRYTNSGSYVPGKANPFEQYTEPTNSLTDGESNSTGGNGTTNSNTNTLYNTTGK